MKKIIFLCILCVEVVSTYAQSLDQSFTKHDLIGDLIIISAAAILIAVAIVICIYGLVKHGIINPYSQQKQEVDMIELNSTGIMTIE